MLLAPDLRRGPRPRRSIPRDGMVRWCCADRPTADGALSARRDRRRASTSFMKTTDWDAKDYARHSHGQFAWALSVLDRVALSDDAAVLDIGCGDGKVSAEIAKRAPRGRVVGIDNSPAMIDLAKSTWGMTLPAIEFLKMDAQALDFPAMFDLAFSNSALHWVSDHLAMLRGVAASLKPGGRLVFSMGGRGTAAVVYRALADL